MDIFCQKFLDRPFDKNGEHVPKVDWNLNNTNLKSIYSSPMLAFTSGGM